MSRRGLVLTAGVLLVLGAAAVLVYHSTRDRQPVLPTDWDAVVSTLAGDGVRGVRDGRPSSARFSDPFAVAVAGDGRIIVADGVHAHRIRTISPDGTVATLAGSERGFADGEGAAARFDTPSGVALDSHGHIFVADTGNDAIRRISPGRQVTTVVAAAAGLRAPLGVAVDRQDRVIIADSYNDVIRVLENGALRTLAGAGVPGFEDGQAATARFDTPASVAADESGNVYVADTGNGAVRVISTDGVVTTIAPGYAEGPMRPVGIAVGAGGSIFVTDERGRVLELPPGGGARVLAGSRAGFADGPGGEARFRAPSGIAVAGPGRLVVSDRRNAVIRAVEAPAMRPFRVPVAPLSPSFDEEAFGLRPLLWPFTPQEGPFEVTGTIGEPRGAAGSERLHAGLDVYAPEDTPVLVVRPAAVEDPVATFDLGSLSESVRIGPVAYIHMRVGRHRVSGVLNDPRFVATLDEKGEVARMRVRRGARFETGDMIGTLNRFFHSHLNVGWPGEEVNPLRFRMPSFEDTIPPTIARGGIGVVGADGMPFTTRDRGRLLIDGAVRIVVDAWDQADGNAARRRLGLYRLGYGIVRDDGTPVKGFEPRWTLRFDRHPGDGEPPRLVYASGSGIPVYGNRGTRFLYQVTSSLRDGVATDGVLDTAALPPGDYTIRILAADIRGNETAVNRDLRIRIGAPEKPQEP